jgi:LacI family transcriptional regulator
MRALPKNGDVIIKAGTGNMTNLTLEDIAKLAGVSRSTVSRVVNNHPNVKDQVRKRVKSVILDTGYEPHAAARSLAARRSNIIGLVIPSAVHTLFTDPYFPRLTEGIAQASNAADFTLSLFLFNSLEDERRMYPRITRKGLLDGVLVQATHVDDEIYTWLRKGNIPYVVVGRPAEMTDLSYVDVDNIAGAHQAVSHLIRLGHHKIGTLAGPLSTEAGKDRLIGYRQALQERGIPINEGLIVEGDFTEMGGYLATQRLFYDKPTAIFVASDIMASGALRALREAGLSVPEDIALVGFDDLPPARRSAPQLTTIRQPIRRLGIKAVEVLIDLIDHPTSPPHKVIFNTELVIRDSCGDKART